MHCASFGCKGFAAETRGNPNMSTEKPLANRVAMVTGSGRGIGRRIAEKFAEAGAKVVLVDRTVEDIEETLRVLRQRDAEALAFSLDLRDEHKVIEMVSSVAHQWERIHILINNAAYFPQRIPFLEVPFEKWTEVLDINLFSVFRITQLVARLMVQTSTQGRIINMSSLNAI